MEKIKPEQIKVKLRKALKILNRYKVIIFIIFVAALYGYNFSRINTLYNEQPSQNAVAAQSDPIKSALVNKSVVSQLQTLQNNSVNVQALFNQSRSNPFQE